MKPPPFGVTEICWEEVSHHEKASWLEDIKQEIRTTETQEVIIIIVGDIINGVKNMANCKAAAADLVQDCWFKKLPPINIRWQEYQEDCVCQRNIPEWIVTGRTVLIERQKSPEELPKEANKFINGLDRLEEGFR